MHSGHTPHKEEESGREISTPPEGGGSGCLWLKTVPAYGFSVCLSVSLSVSLSPAPVTRAVTNVHQRVCPRMCAKLLRETLSI